VGYPRGRGPVGLALLGAMLGLLALGPGCALPYVASVVLGELEILANSRPVEQVLASDRISEELRDRIEYVLAARRYAVEVVGLNVGRSYTRFYDTGGEPLAFNLSACPMDRLDPLTWTFPLMGTFEYLGFFDREQAERLQEALVREGYDTLLYEVDAYSTGGLVPDPIYSTMLDRDDINLAELVFHELSHNTIGRPGDTEFNESVATFVGRRAALDFLAEYFGADSEVVSAARSRFADKDLFAQFMGEIYADLAACYSSDAGLEEKILQREAIFEAAQQRFAEEYVPLLGEPEAYEWILNIDMNNAVVLVYRRYHRGQDLFQQVYDALEGDFPQVLAVLQQAAGSPDPYAFLSEWLGP